MNRVLLGALLVWSTLAVSIQARPPGGAGDSSAEPLEWRDGSILLPVPGGRTELEALAAEPAKVIEVAAFLMSRTEVTWRQYLQFCGQTGHPRPVRPVWAGDEDHPVVNVSWSDATAYCRWADLRLPTEAEWQLAAGPGPFPWGSQPPDPSRLGGAYRGGRSTGPAPVGSFPAGGSPVGCLDLAGNVAEWCRGEVRAGDEARGAMTLRPRRGGSWLSSGRQLFTTRRDLLRDFPTLSYGTTGFRVARDRSGSPAP